MSLPNELLQDIALFLSKVDELKLEFGKVSILSGDIDKMSAELRKLRWKIKFDSI